jgi:hypothetical protein
MKMGRVKILSFELARIRQIEFLVNFFSNSNFYYRPQIF